MKVTEWFQTFLVLSVAGSLLGNFTKKYFDVQTMNIYFLMKFTLILKTKEKVMKIDLVKQLISEFENSEVFKMKVEMEDVKLELEKAPVAPVNVVSAPVATPVVQAPVNQAAPVEAKEEPVVSGTPVKSPIVGVFYAASSPTAKPYVEVGSKVKAGQVLCIVEAMKVMNEIKAPIDGTVTAIMANTEDLVEYDQVLMIIEG